MPGPVSASAKPVPGFSAPGVGFEQPFAMLEACHERVQRTLGLLGRLRAHVHEHGADDDARQAARDVLRYFDIAAPLHHQDEELHVFPALLSGPDKALHALVARLLQNHRDMEVAWAQARRVLLAIADSLESSWTPLTPGQTAALTAFAALYRQHLDDEDSVAYPAAQAVLSPDAVLAMSEDMMQRRGVAPKS